MQPWALAASPRVFLVAEDSELGNFHNCCVWSLEKDKKHQQTQTFGTLKKNYGCFSWKVRYDWYDLRPLVVSYPHVVCCPGTDASSRPTSIPPWRCPFPDSNHPCCSKNKNNKTIFFPTGYVWKWRPTTTHIANMSSIIASIWPATKEQWQFPRPVGPSAGTPLGTVSSFDFSRRLPSPSLRFSPANSVSNPQSPLE